MTACEALGRGEVHVWALNLEVPAQCRARCERSLSHAERERAGRFASAMHRTDYVVSHGLLRDVLARYTGVAPSALTFSGGHTGKPRLCDQTDVDRAITFNLAHADGRALVAVAKGDEVGVDLERIRADLDPLSLAQQFFAPSERKIIARAPGTAQREIFFRYWVAKEAVLKAQGIGLELAPDRCEIALVADGGSARVLSHAQGMLESNWSVRFLPCGPGWIGGVAARGEEWSVRLRALDESKSS